ncbi:CAAX protease self-immunity-domain-containing protein [Parasitella parasitica]|nr:CAAX protease self-immunity-domain-containing protein [Parasitella parasitica]
MLIITAWLANLVCIGFTLIYVTGFYIFKTPGNRNDPRVILARMKAVAVASFVSASVVWYLLQASEAKESAVSALGVKQQPLETCCLKPLLLTGMLFLGPLSVMYFDQELPFQIYFSFEQDVKMNLMSLLGQRNYVVAPLTEEFVFRACIIAVLHQANYSKNYLIFISPLYFGIAHLHHALDNYNKLGRTRQAFQQALFSSLFQFAYTTIFGWYASYLFIRIGSLWPPVFCHSFCNVMGFPDLGGNHHRSTVQKLIIYSCFPLGIVLFVYNFCTLTQPSSAAGGSMYWK